MDDILDSILSDKTEDRQSEAFAKLISDFKVLLNLPEGQRILFWLLEQGELLKDSYNGNANDLIHQAGQRRLCSKVLGVALLACPDIFHKFITNKITTYKGE